MSSSFIASLATAALLFQNVEGHGQMTYPVAREMSPEYHTASGALVNINLSEMQIAPLELLSQNKQADFPPAPWFNLMNGCRGTVYEEGSKFTTLSPGKEFEVKWTIQAPHPGTLKLSILKPSTDAKGVITYESYKLLSEISPFAESGGDGSTSVTMPSDVQCSAPGDCVFQFNWHSDIAKQTYVTCADIVVSGSGASTSTSPSSAKTPTSATPAKSPTAPAASPTPASPATSPTPASPATSPTPASPATSPTPATPNTSPTPPTPSTAAPVSEVGGEAESSACAFMLITHQEVHVNACTAIAVTRGASADNSTLIAHTDDAGGGAADLRLVRVPARDHESGSNRAVYNFNGGYPRVIAPDRGIYYEPVNDLEIGKTQEYTTPLGYIPQVEHTFAYFDQDYGMMNEKQLSIGESTCGAKTVGWPLNVAGGKNLFGIAELTKVALERCETARCAVDTMGTLAEKHGFYSEDSGDMAKPDFGDSAEALVVGDKFGEVWVFHVMTGKDHSGAVWAAQRVPDGHVTVIANGFTIREIDLSQRDWYMASSNVLTFAEEMGWWNPNGEKPFDFTAAYGFADKDAIGPLYTGRRVWRVFDILAPSLQLDARLGSFSQYATYPFSVRPDRFVETYQIMDLLRDHYKDTRYDMTKGLAAGPFGSPVRWSGSAGGVIGGWERPISMYRTLFAFVLQSRSHKGPDAVGGVAWYAQDAPHGSVFVPFSCAQESVPESYLLGRQSKFHPQSAWWAFNFVNNWSLLRYNAMSVDIHSKIDALQKLAFSLRNKIEMEAQYVHSVNTTHFVAQIESQSNKFAEEVVAQWWQLAWTLIAKYSDGYMTTGEAPEQQASIGYPAWWLQASEFATWPGDTFQPKASMLEMLVGVDSETAQNFVRQSIVTDSAGAGNFSGAIALGFIGAVLSVGILAFAKKASRRHRYNIVP